MGSVDVLKPKDCLPHDKYVVPCRRWNYMPKSNPIPNFNKSSVSRKRSRGRTVANNRATTTPPAKGLETGEVKILERSELLDDVTNTNTNSDGVLKGDDEKSKKPLAKVGYKRRTMLKKDDPNKVKFEGVAKKVDVDLKDHKKVKCEGGHVKKLVPEFYAGFGFVNSPAPSSLPLPAFVTKKSDPTLVAPVLPFL